MADSVRKPGKAKPTSAKTVVKKLQQAPVDSAATAEDALEDGGALLGDPEQRMLAEAEALRSHSEASDRALAGLAVRMAEAGRRLRQLELRCPSALVWRLGDIAARVKSARSGQAAAGGLDTGAQYVSRLGYRLAVCVCLNGDDRARGKFISLFVCICKGDYDCLLAWPFRTRIYLSIMDQRPDGNSRRDLTRVIMPSACHANAAFLGRPAGDRNPKFGIEDFARLDRVFGDQLERPCTYVKDDAMYIKLEIPEEDLNPEFV